MRKWWSQTMVAPAECSCKTSWLLVCGCESSECLDKRQAMRGSLLSPWVALCNEKRGTATVHVIVMEKLSQRIDKPECTVRTKSSPHAQLEQKAHHMHSQNKKLTTCTVRTKSSDAEIKKPVDGIFHFSIMLDIYKQKLTIIVCKQVNHK